MPWEIINCVIEVENELRDNERHMIKKPTGVAQRRNRGTAINSANAKGDRIYDTPCSIVLVTDRWQVQRYLTNQSTGADDCRIARSLERLVRAIVILEDSKGKCKSLNH
jgi:hypothetical protein